MTDLTAFKNHVAKMEAESIREIRESQIEHSMHYIARKLIERLCPVEQMEYYHQWSDENIIKFLKESGFNE